MAAAAELTPALILGSIRYGETSRIVRLATRAAGVRSAIAKGANRPRSPFGAALQLFSEGTAHLLPTRTDLHTLTAFDLTDLHAGLAGNLERFHAAAALAELTVRFVPPLPNPELFDDLVASIALIEVAPPDALPVVGLRSLWRLIADLGLAPEVAGCARDGASLPDGVVGFSHRDGGFLCDACARGGVATRLPTADREALVDLLRAGGDLPILSPRHVAAHRRLLVRWVQTHLGDVALPALETWQRDRGGDAGDTPGDPE